MPSSRSESLCGWGRHPVERCAVYRPEKRAAVGAVLASGEQTSYISRGLGRSYGDASLNGDGGVISHLMLDRFLAFDPDTGVLECEAGVSLAAVIETFLPRGFFPPVTPGTKHVTVGGAIASDVHGKNHHADGTFSEFVLDFRLQTPTGEVLACSREKNPDVFWATVGGLGLTGAILSARIRLRRVESSYVRVDYRRTSDLDETLAVFAESDAEYRYSVAWVDCFASGRSRGRAIVMQANDAAGSEVGLEDPLSLPGRRSGGLPIDFPSATLNRFNVRVFNSFYWRSHGDASGTLVDYERFFYPLDRIGRWNRLYGKRGFVQYQVVLPLERGGSGLAAVLERLREARKPSFLGVLKRFGRENPGLLSFPFEGYTLALDFPNGSGIEDLLRELQSVTLDHGGRVYLAKDAAVTPGAFSAMYPGAEEFKRVKRRLDPDGRLSSSLARRVGLV